MERKAGRVHCRPEPELLAAETTGKSGTGNRKGTETDFPVKVCWLVGETGDKIMSAGQT